MKFTNPLCRAIALFSLATLLSTNVGALDLGEDSPEFKAQTIEGQTINLADALGKKPIYLKFWATWCSYCKRELPHAQAIYDQYQNDIAVVMVNVGLNDSVANIRQVYSDKGIDIPTIFDASGDIVAAFDVVGTPNHVVIDQHGKVVYRTFLASDELDATLARLALNNQAEAGQ